jgi:hypothetical protein
MSAISLGSGHPGPAFSPAALCHKRKWALFDHLIRADEQRRRHGEAERFGRFHIDH